MLKLEYKSKIDKDVLKLIEKKVHEYQALGLDSIEARKKVEKDLMWKINPGLSNANFFADYDTWL